MKARNIIYIVIAIICVVAIVVGVYAQVYGDKPRQNTIKNEITNTQDDDTAVDPEELKQEFKPEFINRIDEIIVFHKLVDEEIKQIIDIMLKQVQKRLNEQNMKIEIDDSVKELILKKGIDTNYGARPLRRAIQSMLEDRIAEAILDGIVKPGETVKAVAKNDKIDIIAK